MATEIKGKHAVVSKAPAELYMVFTDMSNFLNFIPEDKKAGVTADFDTIRATVQGFSFGVRITERKPYSLINMEDYDAPFAFKVSLHFDPAEDSSKTDFHIDFSAELNLMMKMVIGSKLKEALDKITESLQAVSEGKVPDGIDPEILKKFKI
jgi:ribosome-associated toxin RatA of RatAB toxin-antitoxin module